jgi:cobalamin-dependent methionine synthase I
VLNSVYLDEAVKRGLTSRDPQRGQDQAGQPDPRPRVKLMSLDLIYDRRAFAAMARCTYDPLFAFVDHFTKNTAAVAQTADAEARAADRRRA